MSMIVHGLSDIYGNIAKGISIGIAWGSEGSLCANNTLPCTPIRLIKANIEGHDYEPEQYYFNDDNKYHFKVYLDKQPIDLQGVFSNKEDALEISQILSTFKFQSNELTNSAATVNWKTYTDSKSGLSLRYPGDYFIFQGDGSLGFFVATSNPEGGNGPKFLPHQNDVWLGAYVSEKINVQTIDQYLASQGDSFNNMTKTSTIIGGLNGYKIKSSVQSYCAGDSCTTIYVYNGLVLKNSRMYSISQSSLDQKALQANETKFDQILSTIKFLDN